MGLGIKQWVFDNSTSRKSAKLTYHRIINARYRRRKGIPTIDESRNPLIRKARAAEKKVFRELRKLGFPGQLGNGRTGPDIILDCGLTVEVKLVSRMPKCNRYYVNKVENNRKRDHVIIFVRGRKMKFQRMREHLAECPKSGVRTMSEHFA